MNLSWWLERSYWEHPDKPAVINADGSGSTYAELRAQANRIGNVLRDTGVGPDDVVVSAMADTDFHVSMFYGAIRIGAAFSGLNYKNNAEKLLRDVARCEAKVAIVAPEYRELGVLLKQQPSIVEVFVSEGEDPELASLEPLLKAASPELRIVDCSSDHVAAINYTSGTSGMSKGVTFTHGTLLHSCLGSIWLGGITSQARNLSLVGMYHSGGIHDSVRMIMAGGTIYWSQGWDADRVVRIFKEHKPDWMYWIIPTMLRDLMRHPEWASLDLAGLRTYVAGEPVPEDLRQALVAKGAQVGNMYGLTEAMPVCVVGPSLYYHEENDLPAGASGKPVGGLSQVVLKDPETGETLHGGGVEGEVCIQGDNVTPGYYNDPERTAEAFDDEGYLHTRDRAYRDDDGWYFVKGRTDDIINPGGEKLSLIEVDDALQAHVDVIDAATIGVAHERFGEVPAAFVAFAKPISEGEMRDELDRHCRSVLEPWKRPRLYVLTDEVPRTAAKRSKMHGAMRAQLEGLMMRHDDGVMTLSELRERSDSAAELSR